MYGDDVEGRGQREGQGIRLTRERMDNLDSVERVEEGHLRGRLEGTGTGRTCLVGEDPLGEQRRPRDMDRRATDTQDNVQRVHPGVQF